MGSLSLPPAPWRNRTGLDALCAALGAGDGDARFVGGVVRDTILGIEAHDIDIATRLAPDEVLKRLRASHIRAVPTGIAHGTITAVLPDGPVEVTTLRRDLTTDGRHATIAFTDDWRADAARRDFTINALYADPVTGEVFDYFGGQADLAARRVRFIGDPLQRIAEDHLRILRFFRFLARFGDTPDAEGLAACTTRANDLMALSRERIADEVLKLLVAAKAPEIVALMIDHGIFAPVLPEITSAVRLARVAGVEASAGLAPNAIRRLAALLPDDPALGDGIGARLKLSNLQRRRLTTALTAELGAPRALGYRLGLDGAADRLALQLPSDAALAALATITDWTPPRLPLSGGDLVARGLRKGPDVARTLRAIEDQWIAEDFPGDDRLGAITDAALDQALRSTNS
ncbi:MAG: CCA tRNA nucleotidyltransferase [Sphingomonas sp.]|uniref:CCA tRNA nucleotidyltransferase n=1 Tax=Sphingomonas sp. TaxID=28214 RepID=UPI0025FD7434|nr:CCA tRNA nucleotidyltransferase [Sphingomonas sp.]MBY0284341.1 CCA tRNA nucleotidyltransferase [Sphingomonas sp.]